MSDNLDRARGKTWRIVATVVAVAVVLGAVGFAQSSAGKRVTRNLGLFVPSEPYTQLYFADPQTIAAATEGGVGSAVATKVSFVIQDNEHRSAVYAWSIAVDGRTMQRGHTVLGDGQHDTVRRTVTTGCAARRGGTRSTPAPRRVRITVTLAHPVQSIGYWFSCRGD